MLGVVLIGLDQFAGVIGWGIGAVLVVATMDFLATGQEEVVPSEGQFRIAIRALPILASKVLDMSGMVDLRFAIGTPHTVFAGVRSRDAGNAVHLHQRSTQRLLALTT